MALSFTAFTMVGMIHGAVIRGSMARMLVLGGALFGRQMTHRAMIDHLFLSLMRLVVAVIVSRMIVAGLILRKGRGGSQSCACK